MLSLKRFEEQNKSCLSTISCMFVVDLSLFLCSLNWLEKGLHNTNAYFRQDLGVTSTEAGTPQGHRSRTGRLGRPTGAHQTPAQLAARGRTYPGRELGPGRRQGEQ